MRSAVWSSSTNIIAVGKYQLKNMVLRSTNGGYTWTRPQLVGDYDYYCYCTLYIVEYFHFMGDESSVNC